MAWDWLGEPLAVDFANTLRRRGNDYEDLLRDGTDIVAWARIVRDRMPVPSAAAATGRLDEVRDVRDDVFAVLLATTRGERAPAAAAGRIDARVRELPVVAQLGTRRPVAIASPRQGAVDELLARACAATIDLVTGDEAATLELCDAPSCGQFFIRGRRDQRWCGPACGTRARVARHARAHR